MSKTIRLALTWTLLVAALGLVGPATDEAVAVGPCTTMCLSGNCFQKCACETPEWGIKVTTCAGCPWAPGNPCALAGQTTAVDISGPPVQHRALKVPHASFDGGRCGGS